MTNIEELRKLYQSNVDKIGDTVHDNFLVLKEILQLVHNFKVGDLVEYTTNGKTITGRIDINEITSAFGKAQTVIYPRKRNGEFSSNYSIVYIYDFQNKPDPNLKVIKE